MKKHFISIAVILLIVLLPLVSANARDKVRIGGNVLVEEGTEVKDAVAVGGSITVNGKVKKSAVAVGGSVTLGPNAVIGDDVVAIGGEVVQAQGSIIHGDVVELNIPGVSAIMPFFFEDTSLGWFWAFKIVSLLGFLALALLVVAVIPRPFSLISSTVQQYTLKTILLGTLGLLVLVPLAVFLAITIIGLPLVALEVFVVGIAFLVGYIAIAQLIGDKIAVLLKRPALNALWVTLLGLLILWLVGWVPFVGSLVKAVAIFLGFGGVLATIFTSRTRVHAENAL